MLINFTFKQCDKIMFHIERRMKSAKACLPDFFLINRTRVAVSSCMLLSGSLTGADMFAMNIRTSHPKEN